MGFSVRNHLFVFGRLRTPGYREAADHSIKLLKTWSPTTEIELKAIEVPDKSPQTRVKVQEKESALLLKHLEKLPAARTRIVLLDEKGTNLNSQKWAQSLEKWRDESVHEVAWIIGGSLGVAEDIRRKAHVIWSLGNQTMSHELSRIVLLEQIYRAWSIVHGHPYHHEGS